LKLLTSSSSRWKNWRLPASGEWEPSVSWPLKVWFKQHFRFECSCSSSNRKIKKEFKNLTFQWLPLSFQSCSHSLMACLSAFSSIWKPRQVRLVLSTTASSASMAALDGYPTMITYSRHHKKCMRKVKNKISRTRRSLIELS
jgi:hypothetical protein